MSSGDFSTKVAVKLQLLGEGGRYSVSEEFVETLQLVYSRKYMSPHMKEFIELVKSNVQIAGMKQSAGSPNIIHFTAGRACGNFSAEDTATVLNNTADILRSDFFTVKET